MKTQARSSQRIVLAVDLGECGRPPGACGAAVEFLVDNVATLKRITFLSAAGEPIAAEAQDGSGTGPDRDRVGDLPSITEFPSLRSSEEIGFRS